MCHWCRYSGTSGTSIQGAGDQPPQYCFAAVTALLSAVMICASGIVGCMGIDESDGSPCGATAPFTVEYEPSAAMAFAPSGVNIQSS